MGRNRLDKGAIYQNNGRFAIAPHVPGGLIDPATLRKLADVAEQFQVDAVKLTGAQRVTLVGIDEDKLDEAWQALDMEPGAAIGLCVRSVKICPGKQFCPMGQQDSLKVGLELDKRFHGKPTQMKFKIGVSGCLMQCSENCIKDFGLFGRPKGWTATVGGHGGNAARLAKVLAENLSDEEALELADKVLELYTGEAPKMKLGKWIETIGLEAFKEKLGLTEAS